MNIFLKAYTAINFGDDLFIKQICSRYKNHTFHLVANKKYKEIFKEIQNISIHECDSKNNIHRLSLKINSNCDIFVYIGGSIFIQPEGEFESKLKELSELIDSNNNFYIIGSNFGPYTSRAYYDSVKNKILSRAKGISFRDSYSYSLFKNMENVVYAPDIIFGLNKKKGPSKKEIGISIIHHLNRQSIIKNYESYINKIREIIEFFRKRKYIVNLFSFCECEKDLVAIKEYFNYENINIIEYNGDIDKFLNELNAQEYIVATRFHATILGLVLNKKILPICYSEKTVNMLKDIEEPITYYTIDNIESLEVRDIEKISEYNVEKQIKNSEIQFCFLDKIL